MNADNFSHYLQDRSLLHQLPYEELKTLALQYPFCQPLQLLLLRKSLQDKREDWETALGRVAAVTSNRSILFSEISANVESMQEEEMFQLSEDYLELNSFGPEPDELELGTLETDRSEAVLELDFSPGASAASEETHYNSGREAPSEDTEESSDDGFSEGAVPLKDDIDAWKNRELEALEAMLNPGPERRPHQISTTEKDSSSVEAIERAISTATVVAGLFVPLQEQGAGRMPPHEPLHTPKPSPRPKSSFTSWVAQFQPPDIQTQLSDIMESKKIEDNRLLRKRKKRRPVGNVNEIVLQSITESDDLVSETLAKVLAQQGQYDKAREMYQRLMLVFPEKSDYFAQQILNIKSN